MKHFFTLAFVAFFGLATAQVGIITWEVNMANEEVSPDGVYLAGGDYFGLPGDNPMSDDDGDGIWTITMAMPLGYTGAYTFTNGACGDWSCKENIVGQSCAFGQWSDRELPEVTGDATYSTCFAQCSTDGTCASLTASDVTFRVDMSEQTVTDGVFLHAAFDGWGAIPMDDSNGDNIYEYTTSLETGVYQYLFQNSGANEAFDSTYVECTLTSGAYTNRVLEVADEPIVMDAYCFNSCDVCEGSGGGGGGDSTYTVTFNVNMEMEDVDPTGVYLAGGGNFGNPGDNEMTDEDGDGIYSITVEVAAGFSSYYTFTNGACGDWSCKENLAGLPCGDPNNYNDRFLPEINANTTVSTCFGQCSTDGSCEMISPVPVTFKVDMSEQLVVSGVTIFGGSINGWNNTATPLADDDGDGIYEVTVDLLPGGHEYKFVNSGVEEIFDPIVHGECTVTTPDSVYTNRYLFIDDETEIETIAYCFNSCDVCTPDNVTEWGGMDFKLVPSITNDFVELRMQGSNNAPCEVSVVSFNGALVERILLPANTPVWTLDMSSEAAGVYFVQLNMNGVVATEKLIKVQ
jgi:hypothetical protein